MNQKETIILFTGDSITDGNRYKKKSQEWDLNHQIGHSYAYIINGILGSQYPEKNFKFKNRGISGNRIIDLYGRIHPDLLALKPDVLSILVGVNDGPSELNGYCPTSADRFETLYRLLLEDVKTNLPDCKIVLLEPFVCKAGTIAEEYDVWRDCVTQYSAVIKKLATEFDAKFLPLQHKFDECCQKGTPEYWSWDGVHPTENGHGLIAMEWMNAMKDELMDL